jgi:hypothetical protein
LLKISSILDGWVCRRLARKVNDLTVRGSLAALASGVFRFPALSYCSETRYSANPAVARNDNERDGGLYHEKDGPDSRIRIQTVKPSGKILRGFYA